MELAKELWNLLKNFRSATLLRVRWEFLQLTKKISYIWRFDQGGEIPFHAECITAMQDHSLDVPTISLGK